MMANFTLRAKWFCVCAGLLVSGAVASPPQVVDAIPDNGDTDVDPALKELRIEFDQEMDTEGGYSICGGGPSFPKIIGKPRWVDGKTMILKVRLKPNHEYQISINCLSYKNFRSAAGESAEPYPIWFKTGDRSSTSRQKLTPAENEESIQQLREAIDTRYAYRDIRGVKWDALFAEHESELKAARTPSQFARKASRMLSAAQDPHLWLQVEEAHFGTHKTNTRPNIDAERIPSIVRDYQTLSPCIAAGELEGGIGYLQINCWNNRDEDLIESTHRVIGSHKDAPGLVIDVRANGGGDENFAQQVAGCFNEKEVVYSKNQYRDPQSSSGWTQTYDRILVPNDSGPNFRGKVVVLIGPAVMSSCESFVLMMKHGANATLIGETTYGSSGNPKPIDLTNGVTVYVPSWKDMLPDGSLLEGNGIKPDIPVAFDRHHHDQDPIIEAAVRVLQGKQ